MEAEIGLLAADAIAGPGGCDVLGVASYGALETLDDKVGSVEALIGEVRCLQADFVG